MNFEKFKELNRYTPYGVNEEDYKKVQRLAERIEFGHDRPNIVAIGARVKYICGDGYVSYGIVTRYEGEEIVMFRHAPFVRDEDAHIFGDYPLMPLRGEMWRDPHTPFVDVEFSTSNRIGYLTRFTATVQNWILNARHPLLREYNTENYARLSYKILPDGNREVFIQRFGYPMDRRVMTKEELSTLLWERHGIPEPQNPYVYWILFEDYTLVFDKESFRNMVGIPTKVMHNGSVHDAKVVYEGHHRHVYICK